MTREIAPLLWASTEVRLRAAKLELEETLAAVRRDPARALRDERSLERQEALRASVRCAGWCLGVLAGAQGVDLLRARREPAGLRWLVGALAEVLAGARARVFAPSADELPLLASDTRGVLEVPLLAAWCVLRAAESCAVVRWSAERGVDPADARWSLAFALETGSERAELAARCARLNSTRPDWPRLALEPERLVLRWS